jgi:hypothetical protein
LEWLGKDAAFPATAAKWGLEWLRKDAAFPATAAEWGFGMLRKDAAFRRQLLNAAQGWRSSPQERTGVIQRIVIFWKEIKRLNLSEHTE